MTKFNVTNSALTALAMMAIAGCQSIPTSPLALDSSLEALKTREIAPQPVLDYALALTKARASEGAPFDVDDGLSLAEAEAVALWYSPEVRVSRLEADAAAALAAASGAWEDPGFDLTRGQKRVDIDGGDIDRSWISAASLSITIPISGRPAAERAARSAEHQAALLASAEMEWSTLQDLRAAWLDWSASVEQLKLLDAHLALLEQFAAVAHSLSAAGELDPGNARMFSIELAQLRVQRESVALRDVGQRAGLFALMGLLPDAPVSLSASLASNSLVIDEEVEAEATALRHPSVARLAADYEAAEARLRLELRKQYPDLTISPGINEEEGESTISLGFGFVPVPVWNANRAGIAEAVAQRDVARARAEGRAQQILGDLARAHANFAAAKALREGLLQGAAPEADLQMTEAQALLRTGEVDMSTVFQALTQAYGIKQELLNAVLEEQLAETNLFAILHPLPSSSLVTEAAP